MQSSFMGRKGDLELKLEAILETVVDGIVVINEMGIIEMANPAACRLFGYDLHEILGQNVSMLMPFHHARQHDSYIQNYERTAEAKIIGIGREVLGKTKDCKEFPFKLAVSEVILDDRKIFTGIIHDLSDIRETQTRLEKLNMELEDRVMDRTNELESVINKLLSTNKKLNDEIEERRKVEEKLKAQESELKKSLEKERELGELKNRFISIASHEFRTPLATILSSASLIGKYNDESQQSNRERHLQKIQSSVVNLTGILNDFLSLSRLEEGKIDYKTEDIELISLFAGIKSEMEGLLKNGQVISFNFTQELESVILHLNLLALKNLMVNIVSNAIKYSPENSEIKIILERIDIGIRCEVIDQGIGIPDEEQKHLFSRFFRASNALHVQGTGLGLNIAGKYAEILGAKLSFESKLGEGTRFALILPF
jgi:two-component system, LuxR family, sensor kinase FixL